MHTEALVFEGQKFNVIQHDRQQWLTLSDIASALYGEGGTQTDTPFHRQRILKLYQRHADEFTPSMTALVKLVTLGGQQTVRVFSLRGAHLLGMLARTEAAKRFRKWVLDVIDQHLAEQRGAIPQLQAALEEKSAARICGRGLRRWQDIKPSTEQRILDLLAQIQPDLFIH